MKKKLILIFIILVSLVSCVNLPANNQPIQQEPSVQKDVSVNRPEKKVEKNLSEKAKNENNKTSDNESKNKTKNEDTVKSVKKVETTDKKERSKKPSKKEKEIDKSAKTKVDQVEKNKSVSDNKTATQQNSSKKNDIKNDNEKVENTESKANKPKETSSNPKEQDKNTPKDNVHEEPEKEPDNKTNEDVKQKEESKVETKKKLNPLSLYHKGYSVKYLDIGIDNYNLERTQRYIDDGNIISTVRKFDPKDNELTYFSGHTYNYGKFASLTISSIITVTDSKGIGYDYKVVDYKKYPAGVVESEAPFIGGYHLIDLAGEGISKEAIVVQYCDPNDVPIIFFALPVKGV